MGWCILLFMCSRCYVAIFHVAMEIVKDFEHHEARRGEAGRGADRKGVSIYYWRRVQTFLFSSSVRTCRFDPAKESALCCLNVYEKCCTHIKAKHGWSLLASGP